MQTNLTAGQAQPASRSALVFIFITVFIDLLGAGILIPVIPYLVRDYSTDALTVGLLSLSFAAAQFLAGPLLGWLSDRYGRRPVLLISLFGTAVGYFIFGLAGALWVLLLARVIDGITGGNISTAQAYIADVTPPQDRTKNFGLIGAAFGLGFIFGPALGGLLSQISLQAPAFVAGGLALISVAFGYFALPESLPPERRSSAPLALRQINPLAAVAEGLRRADLRTLLRAIFALNFAFSGLQTNFSVFTLDRFGLGPGGNAIIFSYLGVLSVLMQGVLVRKIAPRLGDRPMALAGLTLMASSFALLSVAPTLWSLYPILALLSVGSSLASPALTSLVSQRVAGHEQGRILGVTQSVNSLTRVFGPLWAGAVFDLLGPGAPYWTGALWLAGGLALVLGLRQAAIGPGGEVQPAQWQAAD